MGLTNPESFRLQPSVMGVFCCRFCMGRPSKEVADSISSGARGGQLEASLITTDRSTHRYPHLTTKP